MTVGDQIGPLADEFFLLAHDDVTGRPRLHPRVTGLGLAAALLAELVLYGLVEIRAGVVLPYSDAPIRDPLLRAVRDQVLTERPARPVHDWLLGLAGTTADGVTRRLADAGILAASRSRGLRRTVRWQPVDMSVAAWPAARLRLRLVQGEPMSLTDLVLAGLALACGLDQQVLWHTPAAIRLHLDQLLASLPEPFEVLVAETETTVSEAVLTRRV
jgi:hypothetical protein